MTTDSTLVDVISYDVDDCSERLGLQTRIARLCDDRTIDALIQHFQANNDGDGQRRLDDLRHEDTGHEWLRAINPAHGAYVPLVNSWAPCGSDWEWIS